MARKITFLLFFGLLVYLSGRYFLSSKNTPQTNTNSPLPTSLPQSIHPYAIDSLSSRISADSKITIEKELAKQVGFTSYLISYPSENLTLFALMNLPDGQKPTTGWPVVIVNHGYIEPSVYSTQNSYKNTSAFFARQGFLVLKPDYRGHDQSQGESRQALSRIQYSLDVLNLIAATKSLPQADYQHIFLYGHSLGGEVALILSETSSQIKATSLWAPAVTTFPENTTYFSKRRPTNNPQDNLIKDELNKIITQYGTSPFSSLDRLNQIKTPLIIHHATTDESVPFSWGQDLYHALIAAGKEVEFYSYPNDNHDIALNWSRALNRDVEFFRSLL